MPPPRKSSYLKGFTLAEVLITLGVIGVVSALTIPTLINNYKNQVYITQLHKTYNEISQALVRYQDDNSIVSLGESGFNSEEFLNNYFKIIKRCENVTPCFANTYKTINNGSVGIALARSYILSNGVSIRIFNYREGEKIANIMVDTNGHKGPNKLGRDLFFLALYKTGQMDDFDGNSTIPMTKERRETLFQNECIKQGYSSGWGCFGKILNDNWQMNY